MDNDIIDAFLSDIDTVKDYCGKRQENIGVPNCCIKCILNDYCYDVPTRSSFEAGIKAANRAVELIRKAKEGEGYKKVTVSDAQINGG